MDGGTGQLDAPRRNETSCGVFAMMVKIDAIRGSVISISELLRNHGWKTELDNETVVCSHPHVTDEAEARARLCNIGLLTASHVRIDLARV